MEFSVGQTLAELRRSKKLIQKEVAHKLSAYGIEVSAKTIYNWEKGIALPNAHQFLALCDILDADDVLWQFAEIHKGPYAGLNREGRQKARELIDLLFRIDEYRDDPDEVREVLRMYHLYDTPVSAGTGNFIDDSGYDVIKAPGYVPDAVDFALRISGDSMTPLLQDGQIIWIREQEVLNNGDIGIFLYNSDVFCKEFVVDGDKAYLRSLNPEYEDIEIKEDFGFRTIGKVVA